MNQIFVSIKNSNLEKLIPEEKYKISLLKYINEGSYGVIFLTDCNNYVVKILDEDLRQINQKSEYSDFTEIEVIDLLIENKNSFQINNSDYAYGKLQTYNEEIDLNLSQNSEILIYVNETYDLSPLESELIFKDKRKNKKFILYEGNTVIFMPLFVRFDDYFNYIGKKFFFNEMTVLKIMSLLVESSYELSKINIMNIDLKKSNVMIDKNNKMKIIDFGLVKSRLRLDETFEINEKYFIWPTSHIFDYRKLISYMICMFIIDLLLDSKIYNDEKDIITSKEILPIFNKITYLTEKTKKIVITGITDGINIEDLRDKINNIADLTKIDLPSPYRCILTNKGINLGMRYLTIFN